MCGVAALSPCSAGIEPATSLAVTARRGTAGLTEWLSDLASAFPRHAARAVAITLEAWKEWVQTQAGQLDAERWERESPELRGALARQGHLWRALLSGEKSGPDMLSTAEYLRAARVFFLEAVELGRTYLWSVRRALILLVIPLLALGVAIATLDGAGQAVTAAAASAAALGLTWKSVAETLGDAAARLRGPLWAAELDYGIALAVLRLPQAEPGGTPAVHPSGPDAVPVSAPQRGSGRPTDRPSTEEAVPMTETESAQPAAAPTRTGAAPPAG